MSKTSYKFTLTERAINFADIDICTRSVGLCFISSERKVFCYKQLFHDSLHWICNCFYELTMENVCYGKR